MAKAAKKAAGSKPAKNSTPDIDQLQGPDERAISAVQLGKLARAKEKLDSEMGSYRSVVKHTEAKGLHIKAAKRALAISSSADRDELFTELVRTLEYLLIRGFAFEKKQLDLFAYIDARQPAIETAAHLGRMAALQGQGEGTIPYAEESPQGQAWLEAFRNGMDERRAIEEMDAAIGDETLIKGEQAGEDDVHEDDDTGEDTSEAPDPDAESEDDPVHAEFDAGDPGRELDPDADGAALH